MKNEFLEKQPLKQKSVVEDVCGAAAWLCSDYAKGITGQAINGTEIRQKVSVSRWRVFDHGNIVILLCLFDETGIHSFHRTGMDRNESGALHKTNFNISNNQYSKFVKMEIKL